MVLDLRAFDLSIRDEFVLIRSRFSRDVRPFALEFSPSLVWASLIEFPPRLITSGNSDGGLPFDGQVLDSRREELRDVDQKYENLVPPDHPTANPHVQEYDTSSVGEEEHFQARHIVMAITDWQLWLHILLFWSIAAPRRSHFSSGSDWRLINRVSLRDLILLAHDHPWVWIFGCHFGDPHRPPICRCE